MSPQQGLSHQPHQICSLRKALYQAPRNWLDHINSIIHSNFHQSSHDSTLFSSQSSIARVLLLYVDDNIIMGNDQTKITAPKTFFESVV